jgi:glycosyltransferase involved in cell wall biosynthesis
MDGSGKLRLAYFVSHPIQYQAPLLRKIAAQPDIELKVYFTSDFSVRSYADDGFGVNVEWDTPLLDGYRYEFLPKRLLRHAHHSRQISSRIFRILNANQFDAVWVHGYHTFDSLQVLLACRLLRLPVLLRAESHLQDRPRSALKSAAKAAFFEALRGCVSAALPIGKLNRTYWEQYLGRDFPMFDMPYAVDNDFFQSQARKASPGREELRAELGLEPGRPLLLFASKLQSRKRCIDLVDAFLDLRASKHSPLAHLLIIGDGEDRAAIEARIAGIDDIRLLGFRNQGELPRYFDLCDVFVLPSIHEPWGLVVNEAMNAGRAIVVSDQVGCQPDLVRDGVNGAVFEALNVGSLADALRRVLASRQELAQMGEESLRVIDGYSFDRDIAGLRSALGVLVPSWRPTGAAVEIAS